MPTVAHIWYARARCTCGYLWTTGPSESVQCTCGASRILADGSLDGDAVAVTDDQAFKDAVAADLNVAVVDLVLVEGS